MARLVLFTALLLALGVPALLFVSAQLSLDRARGHRARTAALPLLGSGSDAGLVRIDARGLEFRARVAGLTNPGPAVLMLHGFPESSVMWQPLLEETAATGFRAAAFDQRGYSPGARPDDVASYHIDELVADALAVADRLGFERFHLVGHDWGSAVGWKLVAEHPERVRSWTSLSIPHLDGVRASREGQGMPGYIRVFRMRGIAETLLSFWDLRVLRRVIYPSIPADQVEEYAAIFSEPGALRAALSWYRAAGPTEIAVGVVRTPTLYVYGSKDMQTFVGERPRTEARRFIEGPFREVELPAGHWLIQEQRDAVISEVMAHLAKYRDA